MAPDAVTVLGCEDLGRAFATFAFKPFFTTKTNGTGLELTVARGLVTAMGGRLAVPAAGIEGGHEG